jgi:hypothetical protein
LEIANNQQQLIFMITPRPDGRRARRRPASHRELPLCELMPESPGETDKKVLPLRPGVKHHLAVGERSVPARRPENQ